MDNINFLKILFAQMSIFTVVLGGLINTVEKHLPVFVTRTFRYGKIACQGKSKSFIKPIEVPKVWFRHFYIFSAAAMTFTMYLLTDTYVLNNPGKPWIIHLLNKLSGVHRYSTVSASNTYLALLLLTIQCYRRLYDTHFVSVFGKNSRMNITHYLVGFVHYAGVILAILAEAPNFTNHAAHNTMKWNDIIYTDIFASALFLWAWWHQYKATKILGNLRKNINGKVVSNSHHMPEGSLFEFVSSPHLLCEILMYFSLTVILWPNTTWWYVFIWVLSNQTETALLSHWWYRKTFPNYPKERKALIPYVL